MERALACLVMVLIPAGKFTMGWSDDETGRTAGESHQHEIAITNAFAISKSEIRFEQWDPCVAAAECPLAFDARGRCRMINVSRAHAKSDFIERMSLGHRATGV
jgi:formylglycine-generating enzyme required for sulfatase activity